MLFIDNSGIGSQLIKGCLIGKLARISIKAGVDICCYSCLLHRIVHIAHNKRIFFIYVLPPLFLCVSKAYFNRWLKNIMSPYLAFVFNVTVSSFSIFSSREWIMFMRDTQTKHLLINKTKKSNVICPHPF